MEPDTLFNLLSDATRLRALMLIASEGELCVCELTYALDESQPKISRHLALLREAGVVEARRTGTWMHYRLSQGLPEWAQKIVNQTLAQIQGLHPYRQDLEQLKKMPNRPGAQACA